jgi:DNA invertase Pin-like site-specific DNA recombinase
LAYFYIVFFVGVESKPLAAVVRVSHMGDRKAGAPNVHADREQVEDVRAEAERMRVPLRLLPPELDVSGGVPLKDRPSLRDAVEGVEAGRYSGIIVSYLSRLGRSVREQLAVWDRVESAGGRIVVVRERIDTSTPNGRYVRTILLANAERELEEYAERFANLREWATSAGIWQHRQTPRGYSRDPNTRRLVPDELADEVRRAFARRGASESILAIAHDLTMTPNGVRALLRNRVYLGELRVGRHVNPSAHPPLVTEDMWLAAQRARAPRPPRSDEPVALLAGLVRCASCGHLMTRGRSGGQRTYTCPTHHSAGTCPRPAAITLHLLDDHVSAIALAELAHFRASATGSDRPLRSARRAVREAEQELAAYLDAVAAAGLSPGQYADGARKRREAIEEARERLATLLERERTKVDGDPLTAWRKMNQAQRNRLLRSLIEAVIVVPVGRGRRVPVDERARVVGHGAGLVERYRGGGVPLPIRALDFPDRDDPIVLGV